MNGILYLCATPVGNMEDITLRALRVLKEVDLIAAEDTRNSRKLLNHYDIHTKLTSYHEHNKWDKGKALIQNLKEGLNIALISDAGMPLISDPGYELVKMCAEENITVTVLPGANAALAALVLSAMPTDRFVFEGFLPADSKNRNLRLEKLKNEDRTLVFYEAPHRLTKTLEALTHTFGNEREAAVVREITKKHECVARGSLAKLRSFYAENDPKGECVIVVKGRDAEEIIRESQAEWNEISVKEHYDMYLAAGLDRTEAMKRVAKDRGAAKREIYRELLADES